jgi:hypothetical protein
MQEVIITFLISRNHWCDSINKIVEQKLRQLKPTKLDFVSGCSRMKETV